MSVLAAAAGCIVHKPPDYFGVDLEIRATSRLRIDFPRMEVQVKSWSVPSGGNSESWHYRGLNERQFNLLVGERAIPIYLVLVIVPPDMADYAHADEDRLLLRHAAYWVSLSDRKRIDNPSKDRRVPVSVPRRNLLTVASMSELFKKSVNTAVSAT